jgi:hypothetical protein
MKPAWLPVAAFTAFLLTLTPNSGPARVAHMVMATSPEPQSHPGDVRRALRNMESWVTDLRARSQNRSAAWRSAGNLWIEVNQLKRGGEDVHRLQWYVSELEGLRNSQQDASARRHILNNLELEMQLLKQRGR